MGNFDPPIEGDPCNTTPSLFSSPSPASAHLPPGFSPF
jgi:hypothetical protein